MNAGPGQQDGGQQDGDQGWWDPSFPSSQPTPPSQRHSDYPAPDQPPTGARPDDYGRPQFEYPTAGYPGTAAQPNPGQPNPGQPNPGQPNPGYSGPGPYDTSAGAGYPPPAEQPPPSRQRSGRLGLVVLVAILALVIGSASGFLAGRFGGATATTSSGSAAPTSTAAESEEPTDQDPAEPKAPPVGDSDTVAVAEAVLPSTVTIRVDAGGGSGLGSGFVIDDEGRVMTNNHVVAEADGGGAIRVTLPDGSSTDASLLGRSPSYDLAVIQLENFDGLQPVQKGDSDAAEVGSTAVAIGSPLGLGGTVTQGIISAVDRPVAVGSDSPDGAAYLNALQTDAPINRGNSGGPLVNGNAEVIGVNSAILTGSSSSEESGNIGIGFAIPINQADEIGELLIEDGHATYPVINATVTGDDGGDGVRLTTVAPGGAADEAGLQSGDVVRAVGNESVSRSEDLIVAIRNHRPGDTVTLKIERNGDTREVAVELGSERG